jgi:RNA polymerase sigma factor (sigma-70 family)
MKTESLAGLPDEQLAKRYQLTGEAACFDELATRYWPRVVAYCRRVVPGAEAEEMSQETFLRALAKLDQFRGDSFKGWLFSLARTVCLNRVAMADWNSSVPVDTVMASTDGEKDRLMEDTVGRMRAAMERLPEAQRICIKLFDLDGYN